MSGIRQLMMKRISVIVPLFNKAPFIRECLESVLSQTYGDFELIVVDDCSSDGSQEIVNSFSDRRIRFYQNDRNLGTHGNANKCFDLAKNGFVIRQDADDIMPNDRILKQVNFLLKNADVAIVAGHNKAITEQFHTNIVVDERQIKNEFYFTNPISQGTSAYNLDLLNEYDLRYEEKGPSVGEDWIFAYKVSRILRVVNLPDVMNHYRIHSDNISSETSERYQNDIARVLKYIFNTHGIALTNSDLEAHQILRRKWVYQGNYENTIRSFHKWCDTLTGFNNDYKLMDSEFLEGKLAEGKDYLFYALANESKAIELYRTYYPLNFGKWRYLLSVRLRKGFK